MFAKSLVLFGLASTVLADIYITSPIASTSWAAGETATIQWNENTAASTYTLAEFGQAEVSIAVGSATSQTKLYIIASNVDFSTTSSIQFTVDGSIGPDDDNYFIRVDSNNLKSTVNTQYPAQSFSAKFKLTNMNGSFNSTIQSQIDGQSTAPLAGSSTKAATTTKAGATSTKAALVTGTGTSTGSAASASATDNGAVAVAGKWIGIVISALIGLAAL